MKRTTLLGVSIQGLGNKNMEGRPVHGLVVQMADPSLFFWQKK